MGTSSAGFICKRLSDTDLIFLLIQIETILAATLTAKAVDGKTKNIALALFSFEPFSQTLAPI
jgi:hypothetical protein